MPTAQETQDRLTRVETRVGLRNNANNLRPFEHEPAIPIVSRAEVLATFPEDGVTTVVVGWETPDNPDFETVEFFVKDLSGNADGTVKYGESREGPATLVLTSDTSSAKTIFLRTKMRNGLGSDLGASPTVTATVNKLSVSGASLEDGSVTTTKIADLAVTNAKIANLAVDNAKIANAAISTAKIQNAAITNALIANATIDAAKINSVSAASVQAGTISSVNMSAGTYTLISGFQQMIINGTVGFYQENTGGGGSHAQIFNGSVEVQRNTSLSRVRLAAFASTGGVEIYNSAGSLTMLISGTTVGINGQQVLTSRQATVADPVGGGTVDTQARTAINAIIDRLQAHGLIS